MSSPRQDIRVAGLRRSRKVPGAPPAMQPFNVSHESATSLVLARLTTAVFTQTALVTAVLFYFGWARASATYDYFGIDSSMVNLATTDYLLRSVNAALAPLIVGVATCAMIVTVLIRLSSHLDSPQRPWRRRVALLLCGCFMVIGLLGAFSSLYSTPVLLPPFLPPMLMTLSIFLLVSGSRLLEIAFRRALVPSTWLQLAAFIVGAVSLLWSWSIYAHDVGVSQAERLVAELPYKNAVSIYSTERLALAGPGIDAIPLEGASSKYVVRYDGFCLLLRDRDGVFLLLPVGWERGRDRVYRIHDSDSIRIEVTAGK
jgi:hypothetical protein